MGEFVDMQDLLLGLLQPTLRDLVVKVEAYHPLFNARDALKTLVFCLHYKHYGAALPTEGDRLAQLFIPDCQGLPEDKPIPWFQHICIECHDTSWHSARVAQY